MLSFTRLPRAKRDLLDLWAYIAADNPKAADATLDRIERLLSAILDNPLMGRARPELGEEIRSMPAGNHVVFYRPSPQAIVLVRVLSGYMEVDAVRLADDRG